MPLPITRGAASVKAFGWTKQSGGAGYPYVAVGNNSTGNLIKANSFTGSFGTTFTGLPVQPPTTGAGGILGVVADGQFIANVVYYSTNNGATWTSWGAATGPAMTGGLNGSIAYSTTSKRAFTAFFGAEPKTGNQICYPRSVSRTGSTLNGSSFSIGTSLAVKSFTYSPALNYFYINAFAGNNTYRYLDATTISGASTSVGSPSNYRPGISSDGYPLIPINTGGSAFDLRKYTSADLSTYSSLGGISDAYFGQAVQSSWKWYPVNNKYIVAAGTASVVYIRSSTSGSPASLSLLASFSIGSYSFQTIDVSEDATGKLLVCGLVTYQDPKGGFTASQFGYSSTDGGVTWTNFGQAAIGALKNFT